MCHIIILCIYIAYFQILILQCIQSTISKYFSILIISSTKYHMWPALPYRQPPCWKSPHDWLVYDIGHIFCDSLVQWGLFMGHFTLKIAELSCSLPPCGSPSPPTRHPYITAWGVDKYYLKWWEVQLAMHCGEGSLIDL